MPTVNVNAGEKVNLDIDQGSTYVAVFKYIDSAKAPVDLNGYTARCQFRASIDATTTLYNSETLGDIVITAVTGIVTLTIPAAVTTVWTFRSAVYDLEIIASDGSVTRLVKGRVKVDPEVTR